LWLLELEADRLRNLKAVSLGLSSRMTALVGRNGQGKTSLLEAVYLLSTGRSFQTRRSEDLIHWDGGPLRISGTVESRLGSQKLGMVMDGAERKLLINQAPVELDQFLGRLDVIDLTAERMKVLRGEPQHRRRFLDRGLVGIDPGFLHILGEYRKTLQHRNALLKRPGSDLEGQLDTWDERLVASAAPLHAKRREYATRLGATLGPVSRAIFSDEADLVLRYRSSPGQAGEVEPTEFKGVFLEMLGRNREHDKTVGYTGRGPHRDDLIIELDGVDLRRFGSAGQVRGAMIALKFGKLNLLQEARGETPLLLMDDFDSDLDERRATAVAGFLNDGGFQALVATSKEEMTDRLGVDFAKIRIHGGRAEVD
jgi:DNA replication and repair protein RecF